jgi:hypothetical protein
MLSDGRLIRWSEDPPYVDGDDMLAPVILERLKGEGSIALTPVGPVVDLDPADPLAVMAVLREIDPKVMLSPAAPKAAPVPPGAVS